MLLTLSACGAGGGEGSVSASGPVSGPVSAVEIKIFAANDGTNGTELWKTDGTAAGTVLVKDINATPGTGSFPGGFIVFNGATYFSADDGVNGSELWKTDGTAAGTVLVKDINPAKWPITGAGVNSNPSGFTELNGALYFQANGNREPPHDVENYELWKTDGTAAGTVLVYNITASTGASTRLSAFTVFNGALYFTADDGPSGTELWKTDGTFAGTVLVKNINTLGIGASAFPDVFTVFNGALYFTADDGANGRELWKTDGTDAGTVMVTAINAGAVGSLPGGFTVFDGAIYFGAFDDVNGFALWKTDGTAAGTVLVKNGSYYPSGFTVVNGALYFRFVQVSIAPFCGGGLNNFELWKTDGTAAGTVVVKNFNPTAGGVCSILSVFTEFNGALYFNANDGVQGSQQGEHGSELWKSDGTAAGTVLVKDINPVAAASPSPDSSLFVLNGALYFKATDGVSGIELWKSDGTAAGTQLLKDICPGPCSGTTGF